MQRLKGSKNKKTLAKKVEPPRARVPSKSVHIIGDTTVRCQCDHEQSKHYGGPKGWCNVSGCGCQTWTQ